MAVGRAGLERSGDNSVNGEAELARYRALLDASPDALVAVDSAGRITEVNAAMESLTGRTREELLGMDVLSFAADPEHARRGLQTALGGEPLRDFPVDIVARGGSLVPVIFNGSAIRDEEGRARGAIGSARDISELRHAKRELEITHRRLRAHLDGSPVAVIEWEADLRITGWSAGAERIFGWSAREAVGRSIGKDLKLIYEEDEEEVAGVLDSLIRGESSVGHKNYNYRKDGTLIECEWYNSVLFEEDGRAGSVMSIALDVTRRENLEKKLRHLADHDPLTDLLNRRAFDERLETAIERSSARNHDATAVLYMDLDGFKEVNDRYGHAVGDELLREVGSRISSVLRAQDTLSRLGGDEFAVILEGLTEGSVGEREAEDVARRVLQALKEPFPVAGRWLSVGASTGVALGRPGESAADLVRRSDSRMYREKLDKSTPAPPS